MTSFTLAKPRGFSLAAHSEFYSGFTPSSGMAAAAAGLEHLALAFRLDRSFDATVVVLREEGEQLTGEVAGTSDVDAAKKQAMRTLGLDCDAGAWLALGKKNPVVGALQREFAGFFTSTFPSPYDCACWDIFAQRTPMARAAKLKGAFAEAHGDIVKLAGVHHVFPGPKKLLTIDSFPGLAQERITRLHAVARAALDGKLDAETLRAMPQAEALESLQTIRGVGPWTANHIYKRAAQPPDAPPEPTPGLCRAYADVAGLKKAPAPSELLELASAWSPFRMWVTVMLTRHSLTMNDEDWKITAKQLAKTRAAVSPAPRPSSRRGDRQPRSGHR